MHLIGGKMEGSLLLFQVEQPEMSEDEDDVQRKEELQRLLSEQLCDDLLLDSSDSSSDDMSFLSPPHHGYRQQQQAWTALSNAPPTSDQVTTPSTELEQPPSYHEPIPLSDTNATVPPPSHPRPPPSHLPPTFLRSHTDSSSSSSVQQPPSSQQDHSNIFTGTSQSYDDSERKGGEMNYSKEQQYWIQPPHLEQQERQEDELAFSEKQQHWRQPMPSESQQCEGGGRMDHLDRAQLVILYNASSGRARDLEHKLAEVTREGDVQIGALRHELRATTEEKQELASRLVMVENGSVQLRGVVSQLQEELVMEKEKVDEVVRERDSLLGQLQAVQGSVESLTAQVEELSSSDAMSRLRHHYETALTTSSSLHQQEVAEMKQELASVREHTQQQETVISVLREKLNKEGAAGNIHEDEEDEEEEERMAVRARLVAQLEDYRYQLSTVDEEMREIREKLQQAEVELVREREGRSQDAQLWAEEKRSVMAECAQLRDQLCNHQAMADADKKTALEQCRSACLQLHEEATNRLKHSLADSSHHQQQQHQQEMDRLRQEIGTLQCRLSTVQQQYVEVCLEKQELEEKRGNIDSQSNSAAAAVQTHTNLQENRAKQTDRVLQSINTATQTDTDLNLLRRQGRDKENDILPAVSMEMKEEELTRRVDVAVVAAHQLWKKQQEERVEAMLRQLKKEWGAQYRTERDAAVRSALMQAKHHYEGLMKKRKEELRGEMEERVMEEMEKKERKHKQELQQLQEELSSVQTVSQDSVRQCQQQLQSTLLSLKSAISSLMVDTLVSHEHYTQQRLREERERVEQEAHHTYLQRLHHLVNSSSSHSSTSSTIVAGRERKRGKKGQENTVP